MNSIKPSTVIDEMFPDGSGSNMMDLDEPMTSSGFNYGMTAVDKILHTDFYNSFDDIFDEDDFS